jgi:hypothetical protein
MLRFSVKSLCARQAQKHADMPISEDDVNEANRRVEEIANAPTALFAADVSNGVLRLTYCNGMMFQVAVAKLADLRSATKKQLHEIIISPSGKSILFPALDTVICVSTLMATLFCEDL